MSQYPATKGGKFMTTGNPNIKVGHVVSESNLEGTRGKGNTKQFHAPTTGTEVGMVAEKNRKILK